MSVPAVKGYMALCVTPRPQVCDEQGVGQWPMWKRFDSVKAIVDQYIDEPYRNFLARPEFDVDKQKSEEYFYWYTPRTDAVFSRLSNSGDDHDYYRSLLDETLTQYHSAVEQLKSEGKIEEANFLQLSLKYAGDSEDNVYCGDGRVVAAVWGMRPRQGQDIHDSKLEADLFPPTELHTVQYELGDQGSTHSPTILRKSHGTKIYAHQVPQVTATDGYEFTGWNRNPIGFIVNDDLLFTAQYKKAKQEEVKPEPPKKIVMHHVRFLMPDGQVIKELDVEHSKQILPSYIPQLPAVGRVLCSAWNGNPLNDIITSDRDYRAISPVKPEMPLHTVRFLKPNGDILSQFQMEHGTQLTQAQVPSLPIVDGVTCIGWDSNPLAEKITSDRDFIAKQREKKELTGSGRGGCLSVLLNWLLLLLGLLLLFLLFWCFILGKCNFDFCGCDCENQPNPIVNPQPMPNPVPHTGEVQILLSWSNRNDLDIACIDPSGQKVWFKNKKVPSGGELDIDMNAGEGPYRNDPIENIYWPTDRAPKGQYTVILTYFAKHENNNSETPYTIKVKHGDKTDTYTGIVKEVNESANICTFVIE